MAMKYFAVFLYRCLVIILGISFKYQNLMEDRGQFHVPATLPWNKEPPAILDTVIIIKHIC
jgi:hypothetical protein